MVRAKQTVKNGARKIEGADRKVARAAGKERDSLAVRAAGQMSELADQPQLIAISAGTIAVGLAFRSARLARTGVRMLASHWLATRAKSFVKHRVDRTRPFVMLSGKRYHARKGHSRASQENSFPSGHTAGAVAVARAVAREYPDSAPVGYAVATAAGVVQLPRGAHYMSDVVVGAAIGWLAEAAVRLILPPARKATPPDLNGGVAVAPEDVFPVVERRKLVRDVAPALDPIAVPSERERANPLRDQDMGIVTVAPLDRERLS